MGSPAPQTDYAPLGDYRYSSGKLLTVFHGDGSGFDLAEVRSNTFELEWPPRSGRMRSFPELDRAEWVPVARARELLVAGQVPLLDDLRAALRSRGAPLNPRARGPGRRAGGPPRGA